MKSYKRLSSSEREELALQLALGLTLRLIAKSLGRAPSTLSREVKRTCDDRLNYRMLEAQNQADTNAHKPRKKRKLNTNSRLRAFVFVHLNKCWTPEQIAKRLKILYPDDMTMRISHEAIYSYAYVLPRSALKREIVSCLRRKHKNRRPRKHRVKTHPIQDYLSIEERPAEVADRIIPGHWEGDLIMGHMNKSAIGTLVERTTRMVFIVKLKKKDAMSVREAFGAEFKEVPAGLKKTLTYDQGQEMAQHKLFTKDTNIQVYFAHPHSPWERGTSENTNALIRQFFPRGTDFLKTTEKRLKEVQDLLNDRPRKVHEFYTPHEVFSKLLH
jgi:transposase, IS30 family